MLSDFLLSFVNTIFFTDTLFPPLRNSPSNYSRCNFFHGCAFFYLFSDSEFLTSVLPLQLFFNDAFFLHLVFRSKNFSPPCFPTIFLTDACSFSPFFWYRILHPTFSENFRHKFPFTVLSPFFIYF